MSNLIEFRQSKIDELVAELLLTIREPVIAIISLPGIDKSIFSIHDEVLRILVDEERVIFVTELTLAEYWYSLSIFAIKKHVNIIMSSYWYIQEQFREYTTCEELDKLISSLKEDF